MKPDCKHCAELDNESIGSGIILLISILQICLRLLHAIPMWCMPPSVGGWFSLFSCFLGTNPSSVPFAERR
ncbi:hypothetical protein C8F01DRAFT_1158094 [Mycena amicta]|nr:hypothetical protein C8F01DRAFT_1158094 [Mycena amicta]